MEVEWGKTANKNDFLFHGFSSATFDYRRVYNHQLLEGYNYFSVKWSYSGALMG